MRVKTKQDFKLAGVVGIAAHFPQGNYTATPATNQPDYEELGKVFISNGSTDLLLERKDYEELAPYRWVISEAPIGQSEKGTQGPRNLDPELDTRKARFRMKDDDGEIYYYGYIWGDYDGFEPLDDFGMPNAGCTTIEYRQYGLYHRGELQESSDCVKDMCAKAAQLNSDDILGMVSDGNNWTVKPLEWEVL